MASTISLTAHPRSPEARPRALRRAQFVPGVLYGPKYETRALQFETATLLRVLKRAGTSHLIDLTIDGVDGNELVLVREVQRHPVTHALWHVDLYRTQADVAIRVEVPIVHHGEAPALEEGGFINTLLDVLEIECLPRDMPDAIVVDLSVLTDMDSVITVADLQVPEGVTVLTPEDTVVLRPAFAAIEEEAEEEVEEAEEEAVEGEEEAPEGEEDAGS